jgi:hypothetical protein
MALIRGLPYEKRLRPPEDLHVLEPIAGAYCYLTGKGFPRKLHRAGSTVKEPPRLHPAGAGDAPIVSPPAGRNVPDRLSRSRESDHSNQRRFTWL